MVKRDGGSSTSSKSTKLVHGGVRYYLEKAVKELDYSQCQLAKEALKERAVFLITAPHLSMSLPIILPVYEWWKAPYFLVMGWELGRRFKVFCREGEFGELVHISKFLTRGKALEAFSMSKGKVGGNVDGSHNDSRMNVTIALTAALNGATVVNHAETTSWSRTTQGKSRDSRSKTFCTRIKGAS
ncbi:mitochondrial glycerol-3-phosphate dehydrogenase [Rhizina undulata]